jgi:hypothetical protein
MHSLRFSKDKLKNSIKLNKMDGSKKDMNEINMNGSK